jgi:uncharacterized repeat protein (TIGR03803 family)
MKTNIKNQLPLSSLLVAIGLMPAGHVMAQMFTTLHSFPASNTNSSGVYTNSDGANPYAGLIVSSNTLYGTASAGGSSGNGTVFAINTDGTGFTTLHSFTAAFGSPTTPVNSDGVNPHARLVLSGNTLYGTAAGGGSLGAGTVFSVNTGGTGFTILRTFEPFGLGSFECGSDLDCRAEYGSCTECAFFPFGWRCLLRAGNCPGGTRGGGYPGGYPYAGLILSGDTLFGTARGGGFLNVDPGTVFAVKTNGANFTQLYGFGSRASGPKAGLILSGSMLGDTLYGTTVDAVFAVSTSSGNYAGFRVVHSFSGSDGYNLQAGLVLSGNTLYGTASQGGSSGYGTVFAVNTDGTGFTNLHSFTGSDGAYPYAGLILSSNTLYGTASAGGSSGNGTVFAINTDGTRFTVLHSFTGGSDGALPVAGLVLSGDTLYGTASAGGRSGNGTVFSLSLRPQLAITVSGTNVILTWPTNIAGFDYSSYTLQSTTNLDPPALWSTNLPLPVPINGQNTVTNSIAGPQRFYRLFH